MSNLLADHVPHDKIRKYTNATDAEIAEAEEEMLVKQKSSKYKDYDTPGGKIRAYFYVSQI